MRLNWLFALISLLFSLFSFVLYVINSIGFDFKLSSVKWSDLLNLITIQNKTVDIRLKLKLIFESKLFFVLKNIEVSKVELFHNGAKIFGRDKPFKVDLLKGSNEYEQEFIVFANNSLLELVNKVILKKKYNVVYSLKLKIWGIGFTLSGKHNSEEQ